MKELFKQIGKRALGVAGGLALIGFGGVYLLQRFLQGMEVETSSIQVPIVFGLILGASGFVLTFLFELIGTGWNKLTKKKPPDDPEALI